MAATPLSSVCSQLISSATNPFPKTAILPVIWNSDASIVVGPINTPAPITTQLQGIATGLQIEAQGHVLWLGNAGHPG